MTLWPCIANTMQKVIDHALQVHGGLGMTDDTILSHLYRHERAAASMTGLTKCTRFRWHGAFSANTPEKN